MTTTTDVVIKHVPAMRVAQMSGIAESLTSQDITPVIRGLFDSADARRPTPPGSR